MNKVKYHLARSKLMDDMKYNLNRPEVSTVRRCECGMWTRGCFTKCICCQAIELRELELNQNPANEIKELNCPCEHPQCNQRR